MAKSPFHKFVISMLGVLSLSAFPTDRGWTAEGNLGQILQGRAIYVTIKVTECKTVVATLATTSTQPEKCEGSYRMKNRYRLVGEKLLGDQVEFERSGETVMKASSHADNGVIFILGQRIDRLKRPDLAMERNNEATFKVISWLVSANFKSGELTLAEQRAYTEESDVLGSKYLLNNSDEGHQLIAIGKDHCDLKSYHFGVKSDGAPISQGLLGGLLPKHITINIRHILADSECSIEASE